MLRFKCSVHTKLFVKSMFCSQPLTWRTRPKGKRRLSSRTTGIPWSLSEYDSWCVFGRCVHIHACVSIWFSEKRDVGVEETLVSSWID